MSLSHPASMLRIAVVSGAALIGVALLTGGTVEADDSVPTTVAASHLKGVDADTVDWKAKTEAWWKETLPEKVVEVCRMGGTERPGTGALLYEKAEGDFVCSSCGHTLFPSDTKFKSGTGWPSFYDHAGEGSVRELMDSSHGMLRTEVRCGRCDAHLGHVFRDGPKPTGLRYCINSVCLLHVPKDAKAPATAAPATGAPAK